jgi:hypothetical protein
MTGIADPVVDRAADFIWRTARVLEQHRFAAHFLGADVLPVVRALDNYQTPDGGYGFALEPDLRGPIAQPLAAAFALRILDEIGQCTAKRVAPLCAQLGRVVTADGGLPALHPSSARWPSAQAVPADPPGTGALLSTGSIVGLLLRNGIEPAWLKAGCTFCWQAIDTLGTTHPYEVESALTFLDAAPDRRRAECAAERLGELVRRQRLVPLDPFDCEDHPVSPGYSPGEHHFAIDYARRPTSLAARWFTDSQLAAALDHLRTEQLDDGGWHMRWRNWAPGTAVEWRPIVTIEALLTLRAYQMLP